MWSVVILGPETFGLWWSMVFRQTDTKQARWEIKPTLTFDGIFDVTVMRRSCRLHLFGIFREIKCLFSVNACIFKIHYSSCRFVSALAKFFFYYGPL